MNEHKKERLRKYKLVLLIMALILTMTGCGESNTHSEKIQNQSNFEKIYDDNSNILKNSTAAFRIYVDKQTGVEYIETRMDNSSDAFVVRVDKDGKPIIYNNNIK